jgi:hypothetical protein
MQGQRSFGNVGTIMALIVALLIVGGGITLLSLYSATEKTSFYIALAVLVLSPIFVVAAYFVNKRQGQ